MPSVEAHTPPVKSLPNPNIGNGNAAAGPRTVHQPSPVVASEHHHSPHVLHRRFIGPIPENIAYSPESEGKRKRLSGLRKNAVRRLKGQEEDNMGMVSAEERDKRRKFVSWSRKRRKAGQLTDEESEATVGAGQQKGKGKGKEVQRRKDVWVGESFDIGREFRSGSGLSTPTTTQSDGILTPLSDGKDRRDAKADASPHGEGSARHTSVTSSNGSKGHDASPDAPPDDAVDDVDGGLPQRPRPSRDTTQQTFVTARTEFSHSIVSEQPTEPLPKDISHLDIPNSSLRPRASHESLPSHLELPNKRQSGSSSVQPLMGSITSNRASAPSSPKQSPTDMVKAPNPAALNLRKKLKSAMRKRSKGKIRTVSEMPEAPGVNGYRVVSEVSSEDERPHRSGLGRLGNSKSVQFPVDPVHTPTKPDGTDALLRKGDKEPADPAKVLLRAGQATEGTSAGVVEEAMAETEEEAFVPGQIIMRGMAQSPRSLCRMFH